jgi:hypothetical protein
MKPQILIFVVLSIFTGCEGADSVSTEDDGPSRGGMIVPQTVTGDTSATATVSAVVTQTQTALQISSRMSTSSATASLTVTVATTATATAVTTGGITETPLCTVPAQPNSMPGSMLDDFAYSYAEVTGSYSCTSGYQTDCNLPQNFFYPPSVFPYLTEDNYDVTPKGYCVQVSHGIIQGLQARGFKSLVPVLALCNQGRFVGWSCTPTI